MSKKSDTETPSSQTAAPSKREPTTVYLDEKITNKLNAEIKKSKILIPTELAKKNNINVGVIRKFLMDYVQKGELELASKGPRLEVFINKKQTKDKEGKKE